MPEFKLISILIVLLKFVGFILLAIVLIHLLSVLGLYLAIAFPVLWFLFPRQTPCFFCRLSKVGGNCPVCKEPVVSLEMAYPKRFGSALVNALAIFALTIFSAGIVYLEVMMFRQLGFIAPPRTVGFNIPARGQYRLGEIFPMKIEMIGIQAPINTVQADVGFNPEKLEVSHISTEGSFAEIFIQREINNELGFARLTGGLPSPGFYSERGLFGTIYFKGKQPGIVEIEFLPSSLVLANDGIGTNVLLGFDKVSYLILPEEISEEEKQLQKDLTVMRTGVLGVEDEGTQMIFYDENQVLGVQEAIEDYMASDSYSEEDEGFLAPFFSNYILGQKHYNLCKNNLMYLAPVFFVIIMVCLVANQVGLRKGRQ
jgi:hypothetical protein